MTGQAEPQWLTDAIEVACETEWERTMVEYDWYRPWAEAGEVADKSWRDSVTLMLRAALPAIREGLAREALAAIEALEHVSDGTGIYGEGYVTGLAEAHVVVETAMRGRRS